MILDAPDADAVVKDAKELAKTIKILQQVIGNITAHVVYKSKPNVSFALPTPQTSQQLVIQTSPHLPALNFNSEIRLDIFTDSSYAADKLFRCQYGYLIYMNNSGLINRQPMRFSIPPMN
ncbi:hypothetical protein WICPIJ_008471 [Wickerhamomyces pijperi]|uniref:Uncharacterized protein n=1 Tax=Wickerhamomyces pijperi TaxID=599730 RepID=A0A9P8PYQ8_WICPI|nr:hypothetical protein WICPIJ_008471 [Wickerhamomyces pijperi]